MMRRETTPMKAARSKSGARTCNLNATRMAELRQQGLTIAQIAQRCGVSSTSVYTRLAKSRIAAPPRNEQRDRIVYEMREAGHTLQAIGGVVGVTRERVRQIVKQHNASKTAQPRELPRRAAAETPEMIELRRWADPLGRQPPWSAERDRIVYEMREAGHTLQTIGDAIGVTRERVRQLLKRRGGGREMVQRSRRDGHPE
jgi:transposase-like protein